MHPDFWHGAIIFYVFNVAKYFFVAGGFFLIFYVYFPDKFKHSKIQPNHTQKKSDFIREIYHSNITLIIGIFVVPVLLFTPLEKYTNFKFSYTELPYNLSLWWSPVIFLVVLVLHDTYFYWIHWIMHRPKLFKRFHLIHHKSHDPTSLAAISFNYPEAMLELLFNVFIILVIPFDITVNFAVGLILFTFHSYVHLGYEIAPLWFRKSFLFNIFATSTHHNIHHSKTHYNYGLYFRMWDRIMKTEHPNYEAYYDEIQVRRLNNQQALAQS